ncbi:MAG: hypothetical protein AAFO69_04560 [Bacteroidota bacterium]
MKSKIKLDTLKSKSSTAELIVDLSRTVNGGATDTSLHRNGNIFKTTYEVRDMIQKPTR